MSACHLEAFVASVNDVIDRLAGERERTLAVRDRMRAALASDHFRLACVDAVLAALEPAPGRPRFPTLHHDIDNGWSMRMFFWPAGLVNGPHRHAHWTVTGVLHNRLRFNVFDVDARGALVPEPIRTIDAGAGEVGFICMPCVHNVANLDARPSLSLHVFSHSRDGVDDTVDYPLVGAAPPRRGPATDDAVAEMREGALCILCDLLGAIGTPRAAATLERVHDLGARRSRLLALKALLKIAPQRAAVRARELGLQARVAG